MCCRVVSSVTVVSARALGHPWSPQKGPRVATCAVNPRTDSHAVRPPFASRTWSSKESIVLAFVGTDGASSRELLMNSSRHPDNMPGQIQVPTTPTAKFGTNRAAFTPSVRGKRSRSGAGPGLAVRPARTTPSRAHDRVSGERVEHNGAQVRQVPDGNEGHQRAARTCRPAHGAAADGPGPQTLGMQNVARHLDLFIATRGGR
jgi:hypothetical protein